jgi:cell shape-determining protein MreD
MNWAVYALLIYVAAVLQKGVAPLLEIPMPTGGAAAPRFELLIAVLAGLFAGPRTTVLAWALVGLAIDLLEVPGGDTVLIGPHTLGFMVGGWVILQLRTMVLRTHPFSVAFCAVGAGLAAQLVVVAIYAIRSWYDPIPDYAATGELGLRFVSLLYTGGVAIILALPLLKLTGLLGLSAGSRR